jgi:hypothetical protein
MALGDDFAARLQFCLINADFPWIAAADSRDYQHLQDHS